MKTLAWEDCARISDLPAVDEVLRDFVDDPTADGATHIVREILSVPIDMVLHCPGCGKQHIDAPEADRLCKDGALCSTYPCIACDRWTNPPHRSHLCHGCGHIWRPADVPTNGVAAVKTCGAADSPIKDPS